MKKIAKTLLVGTLLLGGTIPVLPSIANDAHAAPLAVKQTTYSSGKAVFKKGKSVESKKFYLERTGHLKITYTKSSTDIDTIYRIELHDKAGKKVAQQRGEAYKGGDDGLKINHDFGKFKPGIYYIKFIAEEAGTVTINYSVHL